MTQSETIFDLFDERGQTQVMKLLSGVHGNREDFVSGSASGECSLDEISFTCLMGLSKNVRRHPGLDRQKVNCQKQIVCSSASIVSHSSSSSSSSVSGFFTHHPSRFHLKISLTSSKIHTLTLLIFHVPIFFNLNETHPASFSISSPLWQPDLYLVFGICG